jgi:hypothetical protein
MNNEVAIDWREGFQNFHWTRRASSRRGLEGVPKIIIIIINKLYIYSFLGKEKGR